MYAGAGGGRRTNSSSTSSLRLPKFRVPTAVGGTSSTPGDGHGSVADIKKNKTKKQNKNTSNPGGRPVRPRSSTQLTRDGSTVYDRLCFILFYSILFDCRSTLTALINIHSFIHHLYSVEPARGGGAGAARGGDADGQSWTPRTSSSEADTTLNSESHAVDS